MRSNTENGQKRTLSEHAYNQIKSMIFHREFLPGAPLVLQILAKKLGVSRMPVIEAIRRLERDGLVEAVPQWGAYVKQWTRDEIAGSLLPPQGIGRGGGKILRAARHRGRGLLYHSTVPRSLARMGG